MGERNRIRAFFADQGRSLGFEGVGFAPAAPPVHSEQLEGWLEKGYHATMQWMGRDPERRADPAQYMPEAQSLVVFLANYHDPAPHASAPDRGRISRYAWGADYHEVLRKRLWDLADSAREQFPDLTTRVTIDTAPVLEKPLGVSAGLGWIGKHSNLIAPRLGSWFFLGEILVDADLSPWGEIIPDHCGTCTRCIEACPTRAIVAPYVVDSNLCISYLTIEHRGVIPRKLRPLLGNRVFGCDDCQDVCPWNRFARTTPFPEFRPESENLAPRLAELLSLDEEGFRARFKNSPVRRPKRRGFLRNVAIALGNSKDPKVLPALVHSLSDPEPLIRGHVAWAIGQFDGEDAKKALEKAREGETDPWVLEEISEALTR